MTSIKDIDEVKEWVNPFLIQNGLNINNTVQDKINALYLLKDIKYINPISLEDVFMLSREFIEAIVLVNEYQNISDFISRLYVLVLFYNWGLLNPEGQNIVSNEKFLQLFQYNVGQLYKIIIGNNIMELPAISILSTPNMIRTYIKI